MSTVSRSSATTTHKLAGKTAVITGGNSGIGRATAELYARQGARVAIFGRTQKTLDVVLGGLEGDGHLAIQGDVSSSTDLDRLFSEVKDASGEVGVLVANAGVAPTAPLADSDEALFDQIFDINVKGLYFTVQKALPLLTEGASIVLTGSTVSYKGLPGMSVYSASKAAVRSLARTFAAELAARKIRVNTLSPGPVDTPIYGRMGIPQEQVEEFGQQIAAAVPLGRFGEPEEMATVALFLASSDSSYITGSDLVADGGFAQV